jgi:hypothetical protein
MFMKKLKDEANLLIADLQAKQLTQAYQRARTLTRMLRPWRDPRLYAFYKLPLGENFRVAREDVNRIRVYAHRASKVLGRRFSVRKSKRYRGQYVCVRVG